MSILSQEHKRTLDPVLQPLFQCLLTQAVDRGDVRGLPVQLGDDTAYLLFEEDQTQAWLTTTLEQLIGLLKPGRHALTVDPSLIDAPLMEAIWRIRQGDKEKGKGGKTRGQRATPAPAASRAASETVTAPTAPAVTPEPVLSGH
ncbi:hypothetical protein [Deinococcus ruber]|uniref:Uncharacterized protein n=1 Tax=Deinococcus ruber TaxID=1848197 RepID=A0A918CAI0_9DEIO|nr:hypothetical protein [Deinococcus ruber]GGR12770.1 hypothetical protein GCM10008957_27130 [Deinococcus ruber]